MNPPTLPVPGARPRLRRWLVAVALAALVGAPGCREQADASAAVPAVEWNYWKAEEPEFGMDYRVASVMADEGWIGRDSQAPMASLYSERFTDGSLRISLQLSGPDLAPACPRRGCYLYARAPGDAWTVLRAEPDSDDGAWLGLMAPWTLQDLIDTTPVMEIDLPLAGGRRCVYTFPTAGYRVALHEGAGLERIDGLGQPLPPPPDDDVLDDIKQGRPTDWVTWPACTASVAR